MKVCMYTHARTSNSNERDTLDVVTAMQWPCHTLLVCYLVQRFVHLTLAEVRPRLAHRRHFNRLNTKSLAILTKRKDSISFEVVSEVNSRTLIAAGSTVISEPSTYTQCVLPGLQRQPVRTGYARIRKPD